jgi:hypothetical protein
MLPINPLTELLVSQLVQISVRPELKGPSAEVIAFVQYSPVADLTGNRLINPVHDVEHCTAPRLVGISRTINRLRASSIESRDWQETRPQAHSDIQAVLLSLFMRDFNRSNIFQQAVRSATIDT